MTTTDTLDPFDDPDAFDGYDAATPDDAASYPDKRRFVRENLDELDRVLREAFVAAFGALDHAGREASFMHGDLGYSLADEVDAVNAVNAASWLLGAAALVLGVDVATLQADADANLLDSLYDPNAGSAEDEATP